MNLLITGGGGFQGSHLAESWAAQGHAVTVLNTPSSRAQALVCHFPPTIRVVWGSVTDPEVVRKVVAGQDVVAHLAAWASVDESTESPLPSWRVNAEGTAWVLEACRREGAALLHVSSCEVYGAGSGWAPQDERATLEPRSPYAAGKAAGDRLVAAYAHTYGLRALILRPCNVWGPRQRAGRFGAVIPTFVAAALRDRPLTVTGSGEQLREYLHVEDVLAGYDLALRQVEWLAPGEVFNLGSGDLIGIRQLAEWLVDHVGGRVAFAPGRPGEVAGFWLDSRKAQRTLGWAPRRRFWTALEAYVNEQREARG